MSDKKQLSELSDENLNKEFTLAKKLFYPALVILLLLFGLGVYAATNGTMGFFKIVLFVFACGICLKYIVKYYEISKEIKSRNFR